MPEVTQLRPGDPRRVGRYRLTNRVEGVIGADVVPGVFLARQPDGNSAVVTFLGQERAADPAARDRFIAESRTARRIAPFCTARVLDAGFEGPAPFLVTEFVPGPTLAEVAREEGPLPLEIVRALAIGAATGLAAIHQAVLVHGRFGPGCLVLSPEGPRVVHATITPPYGAATPAADMLAWAHTVLFAALGRAVRDGRDLDRLPEGVRQAVTSCLAPDPAARPAARAVLTQLLGGQQPAAGLLAEGSRSARRAALAAPRTNERGEAAATRRSPRLWWAVAGVAFLFAVAGGGLAFALSSSPAAPGRPGTTARPTPPGKIPALFAGQWSGTVHQTDPALTVSVRIAMTADATTGAISYPALGCSGRLTVARYAGSTLTVRQVITAGQRNCTTGVITLTPRGSSQLTFTFARPGGATPTGVLTRG